MKHYKNIIIGALSLMVSLSSALSAQAAGPLFGTNVKTGIEVLKAHKFKELEGKKIGLVTNPSGVDNNLVSTVDILNDAKNVKLMALYGPEHGVRGNVYAGGKVENTLDEKTGIPVYSLYGKTRKPTEEMLRSIDALVYDIQDNGCRSYTFISTLGMIMEAAAEFDKEVIVLYRPNPLGGEKVEGSLVEDGFISFVSQFKIPYMYGLTVGELALLLNGERMLKDGKQCKLTVVKMEGWRRSMTYQDTKLPWILPSPQQPQAISALFYPTTGILGELGYVSIGVGYTLPFQIACAPWIDAIKFSDKLNSYGMEGIRFRPLHIKPFFSVFSGEDIQGIQIFITNYKKAVLTEINFYIMQAIAELYPDRAVFDKANTNRHRMFDLVCGSDYIRKTFTQTNKVSSIQNFWRKDAETFKELSKKYYLY